MADILHGIFTNKKVNPSKLLDFGFEANGAAYVYRTTLSQSGFRLTVRITEQGEISSEIVDPAFDAPYTLHLVESATGSFVGGVRRQYQEILTEIADQCFVLDVFQSAQAKELIAYVRKRYGDDLEFLWKKFPDNAIWRRKDTGKWYGALLKVSKRKLGVASDEIVEILDLRMQPQEIEALIDNKTYFPGYHMNKKHWYTILLDNSVPVAQICRRIDGSYLLAHK